VLIELLVAGREPVSAEARERRHQTPPSLAAPSHAKLSPGRDHFCWLTRQLQRRPA